MSQNGPSTSCSDDMATVMNDVTAKIGESATLPNEIIHE